MEKMLGYLIIIGLFGPVILEHPKSSESVSVPCEKSDVESCRKKLQTFLRLTSLPFTSDHKELDKLCEEAGQGYNCTMGLMKTKNCLPQKEKDLTKIFVNMAQYMYFMICGNGAGSPGYLRDAFLTNSACVEKNKEEMECCAKKTDIQDVPAHQIYEDLSKSGFDKKSTCCSFTNYLKCTRAVAEKNCGDMAGNFTGEYVRRAGGEPIQGLCQDMPGYPDLDVSICPVPEKECSSCGSLHLGSGILALLMSFLSVRWVRKN